MRASRDTVSPRSAARPSGVFVPEGAAEFVAFDLAVRGDALAIAGTAVFAGPDGVAPLALKTSPGAWPHG